MSRKRTFSRRQFLSVSAAGAGAALLPARGAMAASGSAGPVRVGVVGLGVRGSKRIEELTALERQSGRPVKLVAACDIWQPRRDWAAGRDVAVCDDWRVLVQRDDIDAVLIATPDHWHAAMAVSALDAKKHVFIESPMALNMDEAKTVRDHARAMGRVAQIGVDEASHDHWRQARQIIDSGALGRVQWIQAYCLPKQETPSVTPNPSTNTLDWQAFVGPARAHAFDPQRFVAWRNYWDYSIGATGGQFYDRLASMLTLLDTHEPKRIAAAGGVYTNDGREVPDSLVMNMEYPGEVRVVLATALGRRSQDSVVVRGDNGTMTITSDGLSLLGAHGVEMRGGASTSHAQSNGAAPALAAWIRAIREGVPSPCDASRGCAVMAAIDMGMRAYRDLKTYVFHPQHERIQPEAPAVA